MSFGWHSLLLSHSSHGQLGICKKTHTKQEQKKGSHKKGGGGKNGTVAGIYRPPKYESLRRGEGSLHCGKGILRFAAVDPRAGFKIVLPPQRRSGLRHGRPESLILYARFAVGRPKSLGNCVFALCL